MNRLINRRFLLLIAGSAMAVSRAAFSYVAKSTDALSTAYIDAWVRKDLDGIAAHLHPQVHFKAPMQELRGRDAVLESSKRIFPLLERLDVRAQFTSGNRTMFAYDFVCREPIGVCRTAELVSFDGGLIREIELFFDARPFEAMQKARAEASVAK